MVGVGGRSGGCHTCRRRRVKCDETHPKCTRCAKAKIACEGYERDLKFVDEKGRAQKRVQVKRQAYLEAVQAEDEQKAQRKARHASENEIATSKSTEQVQQNLSLEGFRNTVELEFMLNKLFSGWKLFIPFVMLGYRGAADCTTTQTVNALSSMYFARRHHDNKSFDLGIKSYSKALQLMSADLKDPKAAFKLPLMTNALSLVIFEMMASSFGGMIQHLGGVHRLIEARGPDRHQGRPELDVLESARTGIVHQFMERKKACFLGSYEWRNVPWQKHPEMKHLLSRICDIKCFLPALLEDMEALRTGERSSPADFRDLCERVTTHIYDAYLWRAAWESQYPNCAFIVNIDDPKTPYTEAIHFTSMARAVELGHYNTSLLLLYRMARLLMGPGFDITIPAASIEVTRTNPSLLLPGDPKTVQDVALESLRMTNYGLLEPHRSAGFFQSMFPMRVGLEVFKTGGKEWKYCEDLFDQAADQGGFVLGRKLMMRPIVGRFLMDQELNEC